MVAIVESTTNSNGNQAPEWSDYVHVGPGMLAGRYLRRFRD